MPIYVYTCGSCRKASELLVASFKHRSRQKCPHCGSARMTRQVSAFAVGRTRGGCPKPCGLRDQLPSCKPDACGLCRH